MSLDFFASYPSSTNNTSPGSVGYSFVPNKNIDVVALRMRGGLHKIRLSKGDGTLLAEVDNPTANAWTDVAITPVRLTSGQTYYIWTYASGNCYRQSITSPTYHADLGSVTSKKKSGDGLPTTNDGTYKWYVGFKFDEVVAPTGRKRRFSQIF